MASGSWIVEGLLLAAGLAAGTALSLALQRLCEKSARGNPPGGARVFLGRLVLPASFLAVILLLGSSAVRGLVREGGRYEALLRAGLLFFAAVFLIHFADAAVSAWYRIRGRDYPLPRILRGFILAVLYIGLAFAVLRGALGINLTPFLATSAILTMILGLAFQGEEVSHLEQGAPDDHVGAQFAADGLSLGLVQGFRQLGEFLVQVFLGNQREAVGFQALPDFLADLFPQIPQWFFAGDGERKDRNFLENQLLLLGQGRPACRHRQAHQEK